MALQQNTRKSSSGATEIISGRGLSGVQHEAGRVHGLDALGCQNAWIMLCERSSAGLPEAVRLIGDGAIRYSCIERNIMRTPDWT